MPPVDATTLYHPETVAGSLETSLLAGKDFSVPDIDFDSAEYAFPSKEDNPLYGEISELSEKDLTTRVVNGRGVYDGLMAATDAHLMKEFQAGRITGANYAQAYVQSAMTAMSQAVSYLLGRDAAYWQAHMIRMQARRAEIEVVTAKLTLQQTKYQAALARGQAEVMASEVATSKLKLATAAVEYAIQQQAYLGSEKDVLLKDAQLLNMAVEKSIAEFNLASMLPAQLVALEKENEVKDAQILGMSRDNEVKEQQILSAVKDNEVKDVQIEAAGVDLATKNYNLANILPKESVALQRDIDLKEGQISVLGSEARKARLEADTISFNLSSMLPKQLEGLEKDLAVKNAQISGLITENSIKEFNLTDMLPAQKEQIQAAADQAVFQVSYILPAQYEGLGLDNAAKAYNNAQILPAQFLNLQEQAEANRAKTLDTRSDGVTPVAGQVGTQKELLLQQKASYRAADQMKVVSKVVDTWITKKSVDEGLTSPESLNDANLNAMLALVRAGVSL